MLHFEVELEVAYEHYIIYLVCNIIITWYVIYIIMMISNGFEIKTCKGGDDV